MATKIVIEVRGGIVVGVHSNENLEIHVVDYDTQGMDRQTLVEYAEDLETPRERDSNNVEEVLTRGIEELLTEAHFLH